MTMMQDGCLVPALAQRGPNAFSLVMLVDACASLGVMSVVIDGAIRVAALRRSGDDDIGLQPRQCFSP